MKIKVDATYSWEYEVKVTQEEYDKYLEARDRTDQGTWASDSETWDIIDAFDKKVCHKAIDIETPIPAGELQMLDLEWSPVT